MAQEIRLWIQAIRWPGVGQATILRGPTTRTQTGRHRCWAEESFVSLDPERAGADTDRVWGEERLHMLRNDWWPPLMHG